MTDELTSARGMIAAYKASARPSAAAEAELWATLAAAERAATTRARKAAPSRAPWLALAAGLLLLAAWQLVLRGMLASGHVLMDMSQQAVYEAPPGSPEAARALREAAGAGHEQETAPGSPATSPGQAALDRPGPERPSSDGQRASGAGREPQQAADEARTESATGSARAPQPAAGAGQAREQHAGRDGGAEQPAASDQGAEQHVAGDGHAAGKRAAGEARRRRAGAAASGERSELAGGDVLEEMALLQQAQAALRGGRAAEALELLTRHAETFAHGSMTEERQALRVLALCAAGEVARGSAEATTFLRAHPRSTYAVRVAEACPQEQEPKDTSTIP